MPNESSAQAAQDLISVTELAHQVGVSVRTIQYYDQMGLLAPNSKGPNNQRLYSEEEREQLYRILVLKYLGYPLKEIRDGAGPAAPGDTQPHITEALDKLEPEFLKLFKRMSTLRKLAAPALRGASWATLAHVIEAEQDKGPLYWQAMSIQDGDVAGMPAPSGEGGEGTGVPASMMARTEVNSWHTLFRTALKLMQEGVPAGDERVRELSRQFEQMGGAARAHEGVNLMITTMGSHEGSGMPRDADAPSDMSRGMPPMGPMGEASLRPVIESVIAYLRDPGKPASCAE